jgi:hypothetical protein
MSPAELCFRHIASSEFGRPTKHSAMSNHRSTASGRRKKVFPSLGTGNDDSAFAASRVPSRHTVHWRRDVVQAHRY